MNRQFIARMIRQYRNTLRAQVKLYCAGLTEWDGVWIAQQLHQISALQRMGRDMQK